ncbi:hypothetical protein NDU88_009090 [Pleurodeles waltl]|uniref:Uncharacterized protein n=1 Tax=Pleurodeles waltl TaxID=8319 RepID=A0AAV7PU08_PLEWA|nr:hypothetical protein NDU88_009090 [Pleurodeles waltl]
MLPVLGETRWLGSEDGHLVPEPKIDGKASPGPLDSQARAPQGTAGWRKGASAPGPGGGLASGPGPLTLNRPGKPSGPARHPGPTLRAQQAGGRECPIQGLVGPLVGPWGPSNRTGQESLPGPAGHSGLAPRGTVGWTKGVTDPWPGGSPAGAPGP